MTSTGKMRLAAVQMNSTKDYSSNIDRAMYWIKTAQEGGADVVALPENVAYMGSDEERATIAQKLEKKVLEALTETAKQNKIIVLGGSFLRASSGKNDKKDNRPFNTSVLIDRQGNLVAAYNKIHLFDVSISDGASYRESDHIQPGDKIVTATIEGVNFGLSICYDLRFPDLYRSLARKGAQIVFVPAAFTVATGKDHWMPLLQARAIENQLYIVAAAQFGRHDEKRQTYGHSVIIDPWGIILAQSPEKEGVIYAEYDPSHLDEIRRRIPVLTHEKPELYKSTGEKG